MRIRTGAVVRFWAALPSYGYDGSGWFVTEGWIRLRPGEFLRGRVEGRPEHLHEQVNRIPVFLRSGQRQ